MTTPQQPTTPPAESTSPDHPHGPGVVKRTTNNIKRISLVLIGAFIALFALLNRQDVTVDWIFGEQIQTPLILVIVITLVAGIAIGWIGAKLNRRA